VFLRGQGFKRASAYGDGGGGGGGGGGGFGDGGGGDGGGGGFGDGGGGLGGPALTRPEMWLILTSSPSDWWRTHRLHRTLDVSSVTVTCRLSSRNPPKPAGKGVAHADVLCTQNTRSFLTSVCPPAKVSTCCWLAYM
jgi:hypothetical protein